MGVEISSCNIWRRSRPVADGSPWWVKEERGLRSEIYNDTANQNREMSRTSTKSHELRRGY